MDSRGRDQSFGFDSESGPPVFADCLCGQDEFKMALGSAAARRLELQLMRCGRL